MQNTLGASGRQVGQHSDRPSRQRGARRAQQRKRPGFIRHDVCEVSEESREKETGSFLPDTMMQVFVRGGGTPALLQLTSGAGSIRAKPSQSPFSRPALCTSTSAACLLPTGPRLGLHNFSRWVHCREYRSVKRRELALHIYPTS
ncbi:unnamed protein product [Pleuronectes platessa]|uniref:Uncharacterized protein n=1 Tax=Pleuronectes platessa TaxID=8262 RepID=A0A9N7UEV1_PLEPL|nr:unnamed protein product [Pleuronectes platessa]